MRDRIGMYIHVRRGARRGERSLGQSLTEFALVAPILLALMGGALDLARVYQAQITLEGATRDAAEFVATNCTSAACTSCINGSCTQTTETIVCLQLQKVPGFAAPPAMPTACTSPAVNVTAFSRVMTSPGSSTYPYTSATVTSTFDFTMLFPWPFLPKGTWALTASSSYSVLQGR